LEEVFSRREESTNQEGRLERDTKRKKKEKKKKKKRKTEKNKSITRNCLFVFISKRVCACGRKRRGEQGGGVGWSEVMVRGDQICLM